MVSLDGSLLILSCCETCGITSFSYLRLSCSLKKNKINSGRLSPSITAIASLFPVTGYLIANLAVADLSVGILCIPFTVLYFELRYWPFGYALCKIIPTAQAMSVMASVGTLAAISLGKCCFA